MEVWKGRRVVGREYYCMGQKGGVRETVSGFTLSGGGNKERMAGKLSTRIWQEK